MNYILRVVIHEPEWERQLEDIVALCRYAGIERVLLKEQCHQILMSPFPLEKHRRMAAIYTKIGERLRREGIGFGINLATIAGHCDAKLPPALTLPYTKFVSESLQPNHSTYCLLDEGWQAYAREVVRLYAQSGPEAIFVDDDFRSLNHSGYLGCFCPLHVEQTARECGLSLTAQSLRDHVLGNSEQDKQVRAAWRRINFAGQLKAARGIEQAVHAVNPAIRVGLMNSGEPNHSVQGRDMPQLLRAFAGDTRPLSRPLGGAYGDCLHGELVAIHQGMALSMAQLENAEIVSEVENWPHTRYTKGLRMTALQMKLHMLAGADGITMNIFDFMGTPYEQEQGYCDLIRDLRPELEQIAALRRGKQATGLGLLWSSESAQTQHNSTHTAEGMIPRREGDVLFPLLGIPTAFSAQQVNFLTGSVAETLSDRQITELLKGGLLLDAEGFDCLTRRGFGRYLGCRSEKTLEEVSAERLTDRDFCGDFTGNLLPTDWLRLGLRNIHLPLLIPRPEARPLTEILDVEYQPIGCGACLYENELRGRVAVLSGQISAWTFAHRSRAFLLRNILRYLWRDGQPFTLQDGVNVAPFYYEDGEQGLLALLNTGLDEELVTVETRHVLRQTDGARIDGQFCLHPLELKLLLISQS